MAKKMKRRAAESKIPLMDMSKRLDAARYVLGKEATWDDVLHASVSGELTSEQLRKLGNEASHPVLNENVTRAAALITMALEKAFVSPPTKVSPPTTAEKFVSLFAGRKYRESLLGDLKEEFERTAARHGYKFARRQYWVDAVREVAASLTKLTAALALLETVRRKIGW